MATSDSPLSINAARTLQVTLKAASNPLFPEFLATFAPEQTVRTFSEATHYASPVATAPGDGTLQNPWTFRQAMDNAVAGNIVGLLPGKWYGENTSGHTGERKRLYPAFAPKNSGTVDAPIWFVAQYPAATNSTNRTEIYSGGTVEWDSWPAFGSHKKDYVRFSGIYSDQNDPEGQIISDSGLATVRTGEGNGVYMCHLIGKPNPSNNNSGVRAEGLSRSEMAGNVIEGFKGKINNPAFTMYNNTGLRIHHNDISRCEYSIQPKARINGFMFYSNNVDDCGWAFRVAAPGYTDDIADQGWIFNNVFNRIGYIYEVTTSDGFLRLDNLRVFNNTYYSVESHDPAAIWWAGSLPSETRDNPFFNNIIHSANRFFGSYSPQPSTPAGLAKFTQMDRNVYYSINTFFKPGPLSAYSFSDWQEAGQDMNSIHADPQLNNPEAGDFHLAAGSPAIGLGRDLLGMFGPAGGTVNAGAFPHGNEVLGVEGL